MSTITSPNMSLPVPVVGSESGPQYATDINNCMAIIDQHSHVSGSGVPITPSAMNINSALTINDNILYDIGTLTLTAQSSTPANYSIYASGSDLYFVDGAGNNIRITQSGSVAGAAGTITGLPSGTASASYAAGTFTFQRATLTPANVDGASFILRNNVASSYGLTLAPPSLGSNYSLVLPTIPAQTNVMTLDSSGNMGTQTYNQVYAGRTMATGASVGIGGFAVSNSSGSFATSSPTNVPITNFSITLITSGRPIRIAFASDNGGGQAAIYCTAGGTALIDIVDQNNNVWISQILTATTASSSVSGYVLTAPAGTYTFTGYASTTSGGAIGINNTVLTAYEL